MADSDQPVTEHVLEPAPFGEQLAAPEHYPFLFSFQGEDVLELTTWNSAAGVKVTIQGRVHVAPRDVKPFTHTHTANTDRSAKTTVATMPRGELLNCVAYVSGGSPLVGQTFVRVAVRRGADTAFERLGVIIQGPITSSVMRAFPGSNIVSPFEAEPFVRFITGTDPATHTAITETVPTGARWELVSLYANCHFDVTTNSQKPRLEIQSGGLSFAMSLAQEMGAGTYSDPMAVAFGASYAPTTATTNVFVAAGLPVGLRIPAGASIVVPALTQANWDAPNYSVREWLDI